MKKTAPRIADKTFDFLTTVFPTVNAGLEYLADAFPGLYGRTIRDTLPKFDRAELMLIIDVFNGTMLTSGLAGQHLALNVADGIDLDKLDEKWELDRAGIMDKLAALSPFESCCLELWANGFWYAGADHSEKPGIEVYVEAGLK
jgi:hypothetical protein